MINKSKYVVCCIYKTASGAAEAVQKAKNKGKIIINVSQKKKTSPKMMRVKKSTACRCISPTRSVVSHQVAGVCTFGDDIRLAAMIYTLKRDDIPSLRLG